MSDSEKPDPKEKQVDPWSITGYLLAGMLFYGAVGWGVDHWAGTSNVFAPIGVVFGLAAGLFLTFRQLAVLDRQEREKLVRKKYDPTSGHPDAASEQDTQRDTTSQHDDSDTQHHD